MIINLTKHNSKEVLEKLEIWLTRGLEVHLLIDEPQLAKEAVETADRGYYYATILNTLSTWNGDLPDVWHKRILKEFRIKEEFVDDGVILTTGSTKGMTRLEFKDFINKVKVWAFLKHQVLIP